MPMPTRIRYGKKESSELVQVANMFAKVFKETYSDQVYDEPIYQFEITSFDIFHRVVLTLLACKT